ncbi:MAG: TonB-dependent receptor [Cyclobacteriaceae bacterium]|nr:TonB-dependent receptor [Cyclobacteriaceae bacterium]
MKSLFLNLFVALIFCHNIFAQNSLIIKDIESNKPINGANVTNLLDDSILTSENEGKVDVSAINEGEKLSISFIGYKTIMHVLSVGQNTVYMEPDFQLLNTLTVVGHENDRKLSEVAGSYAINSKLVMDKFNGESLVRSMNTLPGIRFEERSPSSYRVSIRGNLLRAPYGVRNVKVYWNDIPFTDPTGSTPLYLLDLNNIGKIETIKGPAGSMYGAGNGGVLNIYSDPLSVKPLSSDVTYTAGSYGYQKISGNLNTGNENHRFSIRYAKQTGNGYRDHTNFDKEVIQIGGSFYTSEKRTLTAQLLYSDLYYQTPGGLTKQQYDDDPTQARAGVAVKKSSIDHQSVLVGLVQDYEFNEKLKNTTSIYFTDGIKENPFINNYELEKLKSYGGRTSFNYGTELINMPTIFTVGAEINYGDFHASNHGNVDGYADTLRYEDELKSLQSFAFLQADINLTDQWILNLGASLNTLNYDINRLRDVAKDTSYQINRTFNPEFIPRVGIVGKLTDQLSVHGSISAGFSPPTTDEVRTSDGGINTALEAEKGINYEVGFRGNSTNEKLYYDVTGFWMQQKETIVSKTTPFGTVIFENAGSTDQAGLELLLGYAIIKNSSSAISLLKIQTAYTHHNFTFKDYVKRKGGQNVDYSGNELTGTSPNISVTSFDLETRGGIYFNFTYNFTDKIPLDDANTVYADSYQLVTTKAGWKTKIKQKHLVEIFFGIDNLLNEKYSLGNDLNAFGSRYFNPSPERNYFGGIKVHLNKF